MTVDVELAALHHQTLGNVMNWISLQIETLVKTTPSVVNTYGTPKRQCLMLYPCYHRRQHSTQDWKIAHRPLLSSRCPIEPRQSSTKAARFPPRKRKPLSPALNAHSISLSLSPMRKLCSLSICISENARRIMPGLGLRSKWSPRNFSTRASG